ncbi:uncharacterized protein LOC130512646 [Raphanus sativus]|uniref:Uncharacterized protein LOC130505998 n=1 Tax=Raphanus sativus TaxID=3726 RepID=A0A9W3DT64_RAPSA|nr:uncharacterized protein LOC130505998 [Raphanus sativus]XP_056866818.1 uncharacterized protein LOC130512646 [Raphanus sativus]
MRYGMVQPSPYPVSPHLPESSQMRHEMVQPSPYPGARDCRQYLQTRRCSYGPKCRFNHPHAPVLGSYKCEKGGELMGVDRVSSMKSYQSTLVQRVNELSVFDVVRSNSHVKLLASPGSIRFDEQIKFVQLTDTTAFIPT